MKIKDIVESYGVDLKPSGNLFVGYCPFHDDKNTPNFYVYPQTNSWFCYKQNIGGDALSFIAKMENVDRSEVAKKLSLNILKQKLGGVHAKSEPKPINFKMETLMLVSKICYNFLNKNPRRLQDVMYNMSCLDAKLKSLEQLTYEDSIALISKFKFYLENYRSTEQ